MPVVGLTTTLDLILSSIISNHVVDSWKVSSEDGKPVVVLRFSPQPEGEVQAHTAQCQQQLEVEHDDEVSHNTGSLKRKSAPRIRRDVRRAKRRRTDTVSVEQRTYSRDEVHVGNSREDREVTNKNPDQLRTGDMDHWPGQTNLVNQDIKPNNPHQPWTDDMDDQDIKPNNLHQDWTGDIDHGPGQTNLVNQNIKPNRSLDTVHTRRRAPIFSEEEYNFLISERSSSKTALCMMKQKTLHRRALKHKLQVMVVQDPYRGERVTRLVKDSLILLPTQEVTRCVAHFYDLTQGDGSTKLWYLLQNHYLGISKNIIQNVLNSLPEHTEK